MLPVLLLLLSDAPLRLEQTIVVTAERLEQPWESAAAAITVLDGHALERTPAGTLADAMRAVPGLQVLSVNPGAPPMVSSRGFFGAGEVEYLRLIVDGAPVADVESGVAEWRSIPVASIDRVEVLRGAGSPLFGDAAIGGVVQVFRRRGTHASASFGSFGTARWTAAYAGEGISAHAIATRSDGFREHSASRERSGGIAYDRGAFRLSIDAIRRERDDPGALTREQLESDRFASDPLFAEDREVTRSIRGALRYAGVVDLSAWASRRSSDRVRTLLLAPGFGDRAARELETRGLGGSAMKTIDVDRGRIAAGMEIARDAMESAYRFPERGGVPLAPVASSAIRRSSAALVAGDWQASARVRLTAGARLDSIDDRSGGSAIRDRAVSPRAGVALDLGGATLWAQLSRAFKAPTLDQRFDARPLPGFDGGSFTISNPALQAQRSRNAEVGLRRAGPSRAWEIVAYHTDVSDEIDFDVRTFRYANIGRSTHRGIEAMGEWAIGLARLGASYAWTRAESRGRQLKNIAEHVARASLDLRAAVDLHVAIEHSAGRWLDDDNRFPLGSATTVDLRLARTFAAVTAALEATNVLDAEATPLGFALGDAPYYYPAAGRSVALTIGWRDLR